MDLRLTEPTSVGWEKRGVLAIAAVFAAVSGLAALDLAGDLREGTTRAHVLTEGTIVALGIVGLGSMTVRYAAMRRRQRAMVAAATGLAEDLTRTRLEAERWRREASELLHGLGDLIGRQLVAWGLSGAEREVALLLLKGLSHREVARLRGVSEATARQQAAAVYRKAGLSGRHDLAAFFLEDLLAPRAARGGPTAAE